MEYYTTHSATRCRQSVFLNADDTAVPRLIGREVSSETQIVVSTTVLVSQRAFRHLCRTGLTGDKELVRPGFASKSLTDDMLQNDLHLLYDFRLGYLLVDDNRREVLKNLSVLDNLLDKSRLNHTTIVGNGIVECQDRYWRTLSFISNAHPRQSRLRPVSILPVLVFVRESDPCRRIARYRNVQVGCQSEVVHVLNELLRLVVIVLVDDSAHTDIRADHQCLRQIHTAIAATAPVVVLHVASVHIPHASTGFHIFRGIAIAVVKYSHDTCGLEHRPRLHQVADGVVPNLTVLAVEAFLHVDDSLNVARLDIHDNGNTDTSVDLTKLIDNCSLGNILHLHVDGRYYVSTVDRLSIGYVQILVEHLPSVDYSVGTTENGVIVELQSAPCRVLSAIHVADGALSQRAERTPTGVELLPVESALELRQIEHRQSLHLGECTIVDAVVPNRPVLAHLPVSLFEVSLESRSRLRREYMVQSLRDGVNFDVPQRVVTGRLQRVKVHVYLELRQRGRHKLSVATENIATNRFHLHAVLLLLRRHLHPVVTVDGHSAERLYQYGKGANGQTDSQTTEPRKYLFIVEFTTHL